MDSNRINATEARLNSILNNIINNQINNRNLENIIEEKVNESKIETGVITKFYPYLDKAEVKLDKSNKVVLCKILHRYGGDMIDFYTPLDAEEIYDEALSERAIIPKARNHVCVLQIRDADDDENLILGYYQNEDVVGFEPAQPGNLNITSITEPNLYWIRFGRNGLDLRLPKILTENVGDLEENMVPIEHYTKEEVDELLKKIKSGEIGDTGLSYEDLLTLAEDYNQKSSEEYTLFRGDCWTINNNFESSAAITSESTSDFTVTGTFRTNQDMIGIYWNSEDMITHPYISYGKRVNYSNVIFECDVNFSNCLFDTLTDDFASTITIEMNDGSIYYLKTREYMTYANNKKHLKINFNDIIIPEYSEYIDKRGNVITVSSPFRLDVSNVKFIMFVLIPPTYTKNDNEYTIRENLDYYCKFTNIQVTKGEICKERVRLEPHKYRICEGYDDFYNLNPFRVCREMRKLGYVEWCDLYIGASHFYEKSGVVGDRIPISGVTNADPHDTSNILKFKTGGVFSHARTEKMVLDSSIPLNKAFRAWLDCYSRELKNNDCPNLVVSVSMENLQCPHDWRQKQYAPSEIESIRQDNPNGYAMTGWVPSTFFYSPCHEDILPYMQSVSEACLDIVVANDMQPILQLGEAWWWWNERVQPKDENDNPIDVEHWQPPCFYDEKTKAKYRSEFGKEMPVYTTSWGDFDAEVIDWLNKQIVNYSWGLRSVVKKEKYNNGLYTALFFPPSVLDTDRVPPMMQRVNYLSGIYSPQQLDILQLEDYDWVTGISEETKERDRSHHQEIYSIGQNLGFTKDNIHYFGGFVQYPEDATEFWREIQKAMDDAIEQGFAEVYVWAGSQVRRDNKIIGHSEYEMVQYLLYNGDSNIEVISSSGNEEYTDTGNVQGGWHEFPRTGNFWNVTDEKSLKYRRHDNVVELTGEVHLYQNSDNKKELLVGVLPLGFRPPQDTYFQCVGTKVGDTNDDGENIPYTWTCCIRPNGEVYVMNVVRQNAYWSMTPTSGNRFVFDDRIIVYMVK